MNALEEMVGLANNVSVGDNINRLNNSKFTSVQPKDKEDFSTATQQVLGERSGKNT